MDIEITSPTVQHKLYRVVDAVANDIGLELEIDVRNNIFKTLCANELIFNALDISNINLKLVMYVIGLADACIPCHEMVAKTAKFVKGYHMRQAKQLNSISE